MPTRKPLTANDGRSPRRRLADSLTQLREKSGLSLRDLAEKTGWDHSHLSRMEQGKALGGPEVVEALDQVYGTTPVLMELWEIARDQSAFRDKYQRYMLLESTAESIYMYSQGVLPGLLQTEAYARELLGQSMAEIDIDEQVTARLDRQVILRGDDAVEFRAVIDESTLRRPLRDTQTWRQQLAHLVAMAELPNVAIQVLPLTAGLHCLSNTDLILLWQPDGTYVAYSETGYYGELYEDSRDARPMRVAYDRLRDLALSPRDSVALIEQLMEDSSCDPPA
jgi:transcriptional regulator with XRE-family HTH domain